MTEFKCDYCGNRVSIGGCFWHNNQQMAAAKWMPLPKPQTWPHVEFDFAWIDPEDCP